MKLHLAWIVARAGRRKQSGAYELVADYVKRTRTYAEVEVLEATSEAELLAKVEKLAGRSKPMLVLLDSRGKLRSSEEVAGLLRDAQDDGTQHAVFAIGGADGWSESTKARADELLSFGRITLPHELARVVLAEQVYRAFTILAGHPYLTGH